MSLVRVLGVVGRALVAAGVLLLLFTAYQLWGTGVFEAQSQSTLRHQLSSALPPAAAGEARRAAAGTVARPGAPPATAAAGAVPATGQPVGIIEIPKIGLDQVIVEGVGTDQLRLGPGHYPGTPLPGQPGNVAIAGHRTTYGHPFYNLDAVTPGSAIVITTAQGLFTYRATSQQVVAPTDTSVIDPSPGAVLTLTTCNPRYSAAQRLVVKATLAASVLFGPNRARPGAGGAGPGAGTAPHGAAGLAGGATGGDWLPALLWGLLLAALAATVLLLARRSRRPWLVYLPGAAVLLIALFFFFASLSPLLPASF